MNERQLGDAPVHVTSIGLGTMTFGEQNTEAEAFAQLDLARDRGVNLIDVAEMYPVPPRAETFGATESIVGNWLAARGRRDDVVLATKASGPSEAMPWIRDGRSDHTPSHLNAALEGSLKRLRTDYVDLYQLHWPARPTNCFGRLGYTHDDDAPVDLVATLEAAKALIDAGKVRYLGVSNETPWGVMTFVRLAEAMGLPRIVSIQNPYSFLNRSFEVGLAEVAIRERVPLLAYSPLAFGMLTGKYQDDPDAPGRVNQFSRFVRYSSDTGRAAAAEYVALARAGGLSPAQMAIAFAASRPFCASVLVGATTLEQLRENLDAADVVLDAEILAAIEDVHARFPIPCP